MSCMSVCLSFHLCIILSFCRSVCHSMCIVLSFYHCRSIYPSFYLSSIYPYIISVCLSSILSFYCSVCLSVLYLSVVPPIHHPFCLSAYMTLYFFFLRCNCPFLPSFSTARTLLLQYECETAAQVV